MDLTEAFRSEDISKTDFFDFVVTPDTSENQQQSLNFSRTLKSMGIFIDSAHETSNGTGDYHEHKDETNNNNLMMATNEIAENIGIHNVVNNFVDHPFWSTTCDKETVRLETAILEDLNKFCWNQESDAGGVTTVNGDHGLDNGKDPLVSNNTDGAIYTLTVLNSDQPPGTWYRVPDQNQIIKEEDVNQPSPHEMDTLSSHHTQQTPLDLDSILSIIPSGQQQNGHHYQPASFQTNLTITHLDGDHMKPEYAFDDSGYPQKDIDNHHLDSDTNFNNNNNDWKLNNNNNNNNTASMNDADSLLRSALQGKAFLGRYNSPKNGIKGLDGHRELRRALSTPPSGSKTPLDQSPAFINPDDDMDMKHSPLLVLDQTSVIYDDARVLALADSDNPSSVHSMDDILLSQLDAASYPEDYEKLKRIANEVAESMGQPWVNLDQTGNNSQGIYINAHVANELGMTNNLSSSPLPTPPKTSKKFAKKQTNGTKLVHNNQVHSNGIRKERSLHYCSICSKGFKDKYSVNVHIRTHTGEKPFACSLCGKSFRQKAHLAKHYQTHIAQKNAAASSNGVSKSAGNKRFTAAKAT